MIVKHFFKKHFTFYVTDENIFDFVLPSLKKKPSPSGLLQKPVPLAFSFTRPACSGSDVEIKNFGDTVFLIA